MPRPHFLRWLSLPPSATRVQEQVDPTALSSSPTEEDRYWGRTATGTEEDYYWRRLSDNWYQIASIRDTRPGTG